VIGADAAGQSDVVPQQALTDYTKQHMGTGRTLFLAGRFESTTLAAKLAANPQSNGQIYVDAQAACSAKTDSITQAHCVTDYVSSRSQPSANPQPVRTPERSDALFNLEFASPRWTPDTAGLALAAAGILAVTGAALGLRRRRHLHNG
jgi:hypothetical protein